MSGINMAKILRDVRNHDLIITPRLNEWLMQHGDDPVSPKTMKIIADQLVTPPRIRSGSFASSSAGACERKQVLAYLGAPTLGAIDPQLQNIFNDGKWRHLRWQAMLLDAGILDRIEAALFWRRMRARGTMDGVGTVPEDHPRSLIRGLEFGFELKGCNSFVFHKAVKQDHGIKEEHENQVARYFLKGGWDIWVTIYENKDTQEWFEWVSFPDLERIEAQKQELVRLNKSVDKQKLPPILNQCKIHMGEFKECPFGGTAQGACLRSGDWPNLRKLKGSKR